MRARTTEEGKLMYSSENTYWLRRGSDPAIYPTAMYWAFELMVWEAIWQQEDEARECRRSPCKS